MDDYPASDPIPEPSRTVDEQFNELIQFLTNSSDMRKTATSSLKQGLIAGAGALIGGFMLGPVGGLVGGVAGSMIGFAQVGDYDGAVLALAKLETSQRKILMQSVGEVLVRAGATANQFETSTAFRDVLVDYASRPGVRDELWNACVRSVRQG